MKEFINLFLDYGSLVAGFFTIMVFALLPGALKPIYNRQLFAILLFFIITDVIGWKTGQLKINNLVFYNIVSAIQFLLITLIIYSHSSIKSDRKIIFFSCVSGLCFYLYNMFLGQGIEQFGSHNYVVFALLISIVSFFRLRQLIFDTENIPSHQLEFWFLTATIIQYAAGVPVWSAYLLIIHYTGQAFLEIFTIVSILYFLWFSIIIFGLIWTRSKRK